MKTYRKLKVVTIIISLLVLGFSISSCKGAKANGKPPEKLPPKLVNAIITDSVSFTPRFQTSGRAKPYNEVLLSVEMPGKIISLPINVGKDVKKGDLIARVRSIGLWSQRNQAKSQIDTIKTSLSQSEKDLKSTEKLVSEGVVNKRTLDLAKLKVKSEKFQLKSAKSSLSRVYDSIRGTTVRAPFDGVISNKNVHEGNYTGPGAPLARLVDLSRIKIETGLSEQDISQFELGDTVSVTSIAWPGETLTGTIEIMSPSINVRTGLFPVTIVVKNSKLIMANGKTSWKIKEGMNMTVSFARKKITGIFIPVDSIIKRDGKVFVFKSKDSRATPDRKKNISLTLKKTEIQTGTYFDGWVLVKKGINPKDILVINSVARLKDGIDIRTKIVKGFSPSHK